MLFDIDAFPVMFMWSLSAGNGSVDIKMWHPCHILFCRAFSQCGSDYLCDITADLFWAQVLEKEYHDVKRVAENVKLERNNTLLTRATRLELILLI